MVWMIVIKKGILSAHSVNMMQLAYYPTGTGKNMLGGYFAISYRIELINIKRILSRSYLNPSLSSVIIFISIENRSAAGSG